MKKRRSSFVRRVFKILAWFLIISMVIAIVGAISVFTYVARDLPSSEQFSQRRVIESTKIYDRTGTVLLYDIHGEEKRTVIPAKDIPETVKKATLAVEDSNFYNHVGVEPKAILRAAYANFRKRRITQGGSTITQQLVVNTLLSRFSERGTRTIFRKIRDAILAIELERKYSKDEILTFYLNQIPYGANAYGVESAAQTYFGKSARDLTIAQAAVLAALPKAPTYYSPYGSHRENLLQRKNFVLGRMRALNFISAEDHAIAKTEKVEFMPLRQEIKAPHFVFHVRELLENIYGERYLEEGGLRIITSLDWDLQEKAEELVKTYALKNEKQYKAENAALVAIDPHDGDIVAMVGSRDYFDTAIDGNVNVATRSRQPGSSFKPFAYATAFAKGYTPDTTLFDLETNFSVEGAKPYMPQNYDEQFRGPVLMKQALAQSLNVPSVKTLYLAGLENTLKTAETLGISTLGDRSRFGLSLVLGGGEVMLLEQTNAYAAFAADGLFHAPRPILAIQDVSGKSLREYPVEEKRGVDEEVARQITAVLSSNELRTPTFGAQSALNLGELIPAAAKTGTTQENRDAWVLGYTTGIAAGVWVGNNNNTPMTQKGAGISAAGPLWNEFMKFAAKTYAAQPFTPPQEIVTGKLVLDGKIGGELVLPFDKLSGKRATSFTPEHLRENHVYTQVHTILAYVDKNYPRGPVPENPQSDPQYWGWEHPIEQWVMEQNAQGAHYNETPPEEYDTIHTAAGQPIIILRSPFDNEIIRVRQVSLFAEVQAQNPIHRVEFYFDNFFIGSDFAGPYLYTYTLPDTVRGQMHSFTVKVFDAVENTAKDTRAVIIDPSSGVGIESEIPEPPNDATPEEEPVPSSTPTPYSTSTVYLPKIHDSATSVIP